METPMTVPRPNVHTASNGAGPGRTRDALCASFAHASPEEERGLYRLPDGRENAECRQMFLLVPHSFIPLASTSFKKDFTCVFFRQRGRERERGEDTSMTSTGCPLPVPQVGTRPTRQACALTGNRIGELLFGPWNEA